MLANEDPIPEAKQVKFSELFSNLPENVQTIDAAGRREQLAERKRGVYARFGY